jgi:hypothetical protein
MAYYMILEVSPEDIPKEYTDIIMKIFNVREKGS